MPASRSSARDLAQPSLREFVILMATLMSVVAMAVDGMLPALAGMQRDFGVAQASDMQYVVLVLFLGLSAGQLVAGPAADAFGRKPVIVFGFALFVIGCVVSTLADTLPTMLVGRVLQGLGAGAPRVVSTAMVRDRYEGSELARVNSFVTTTFILVPMLAPSLGQVITWALGWRAIFVFFALMAVASGAWLWWRQPETLPANSRKPLRFREVGVAFHECLRHPDSWPFVLALGLVFSPLFAYLSNAQIIFGDIYGQPKWFPVLFGSLASMVGVASAVNARWVMRLGAARLVGRALRVLIGSSAAFAAARWAWPHIDSLPVSYAWMAVSFFCFGLLFGNLMALSLQPLGHRAGVGSALMSTVSNLIATPIGAWVGHGLNGSIDAMVWGVGLCALGAYAVTARVRLAQRTPQRVV